jgi:hypothetical protein
MAFFSTYGAFIEPNGETVLDHERRDYTRAEAEDTVRFFKSVPYYMTIYCDEYDRGQLRSARRWDRNERGEWERTEA